MCEIHEKQPIFPNEKNRFLSMGRFYFHYLGKLHFVGRLLVLPQPGGRLVGCYTIESTAWLLVQQSLEGEGRATGCRCPTSVVQVAYFASFHPPVGSSSSSVCPWAIPLICSMSVSSRFAVDPFCLGTSSSEGGSGKLVKIDPP